jgi:2-polyprenyl-3-methyl-5-hydroxy-6-metoxy-1,4-benzoquinol methylase
MSEDVQRRTRDIDYAAPLSEKAIQRGRHRKRVGGRWDEMGTLQLEFLIARGLRPEHRLLDVGCGSLRAGIRFVDYLAPEGYYGIDINQTLLDAGYEHELSEELRSKLPRDHLRATDRFDGDFGIPFDFAIAQSVFTHISLNQIRLCLFRVAKVMPPGGRFFASYFEAPPAHPIDKSRADGALWTERNAFFYYRRDLRYAALGMPWEVRHIGDWSHPRHQQMMEYQRLEAVPPRKRPPARLRRLRLAPQALKARLRGGQQARVP